MPRYTAVCCVAGWGSEVTDPNVGVLGPKRTKAGTNAGFCSQNRLILEDANVLGARTLRTTALVEGHLLAFAELLEADAFDGRHVEEQVGARLVRDETETLVSETLDRTFSHAAFLQRIRVVVERKTPELVLAKRFVPITTRSLTADASIPALATLQLAPLFVERETPPFVPA